MNNKSDKYVMASIEAIVNEMRSGDTIWAGSTTSISVAFLDALAKRQNELKNVTILVARGNKPCKILDELKYKILSAFSPFLQKPWYRPLKRAMQQVF